MNKPLSPCPFCKFSRWHTDLTAKRCQKKFKISQKTGIEKFISSVRNNDPKIIGACNRWIGLCNELKVSDKTPNIPKIQDQTDSDLFGFFWQHSVMSGDKV